MGRLIRCPLGCSFGFYVTCRQHGYLCEWGCDVFGVRMSGPGIELPLLVSCPCVASMSSCFDMPRLSLNWLAYVPCASCVDRTVTFSPSCTFSCP